MTIPTAGALAGIRVIDLSRVLGGPYCGQVLGDHGADVLKIEPPQGDETRTWGPPFQEGVAAYYIGLNRNKRGMYLDLSQESAREALYELLADADVLIENFKTGTMEKWGIGYEALAARFPRLIHCRVSGFGADGPLGGLVGYDASIQAMTGIMSVNGEPNGEALRVGVPLVDQATGMNAVIGVLMALYERTRSGLGQFVEASLFDTGLSLLHPYSTNWFANQQPPKRSGNAHANIYPYDIFPSASVPIFLGVGNDKQFALLCQCLDAPSLGDDPRFATPKLRSLNRAELRSELVSLLANREGGQFAEQLLRSGVPSAPLLNIEAALQHPHTRHRGMVVKMGDSYTGIASPIKLSRTPASYRLLPPVGAPEEAKNAK